MAHIGFVGLGHMGLPMAINLVKAGHRVTGFDLQAAARERFVESGGLAATHLPDIAKEQDVIMTMLQTGQQVTNVLSGVDGLMNNAKSGTLFIDCSSIDIKTSREVHQRALEKQFPVVDAPVSGGVAGATAGTLTFMVGGTQEAFVKAQLILSSMGKKIIHTGGAGSGQAAKICNNMILGISMIAISEAFTLAEHLELSPQKLFEVVSNSSGQCWAMTQYVPVPGILEHVPASNEYKAGFTAAMMLKDLELSQNAAQLTKVKTSLGEKSTEIYKKFVDQGMGELDFSAIIKLISG